MITRILSRVLLGERSTGRLGRLAFLFYSGLAAVIFLAASLLVIAVFGNLPDFILAYQGRIPFSFQTHITLIGLIGIGLIVGLIFFIQANLVAKRLRDAGLNGWKSCIIGILTLGPVIYLPALLIPGDYFKRHPLL